MYSISLRLSLLLVCFIGITVGWVPHFENKWGRRSIVLQLAESNSESRQLVPEQIWTTSSESAILIEDLLFHPYFQVQGILDTVSDRADALAAATVFPLGKQEQCIGSDCDQECLIPEEWTPTSGEMDVSEVLRFLGIRRVT